VFSISTRARVTIAFIALYLACFTPAHAASTGVVRGNVTVHGTASGGVTVTIRNAQTTLTTTTDANGNYAFPLVPFGHYLGPLAYTAISAAYLVLLGIVRFEPLAERLGASPTRCTFLGGRVTLR